MEIPQGTFSENSELNESPKQKKIIWISANILSNNTSVNQEN